MEQTLNINNLSLLLSSALLVVAIFISYKEELGLGKDIVIAGVRAVIQLFFIGFVLEYIFAVDNTVLTLVMVAFMISNAAYNSHKRSNNMPNSLFISFASIGTGTVATLVILVLTGAIELVPSQVVPITGMIASNAMVGVGLTFTSLDKQFKAQRQQIQEMLSLGATPKQASKNIISDSIKNGMAPTIDSTKTVGLVSLPGMMSGLIFAGVEPTAAIRYQIVVMFMLVAVTSLSGIIASYLAYKNYYNDYQQLLVN